MRTLNPSASSTCLNVRIKCTRASLYKTAATTHASCCKVCKPENTTMTGVHYMVQVGCTKPDAGFVHICEIWQCICTRDKPLNTLKASYADASVMTDDDLRILWLKLLMLTPCEASARVLSACTAKPIQSGLTRISPDAASCNPVSLSTKDWSVAATCKLIETNLSHKKGAADHSNFEQKMSAVP